MVCWGLIFEGLGVQRMPKHPDALVYAESPTRLFNRILATFGI